ncbi:carboxypeptidase-like regulatory domain-containing protein [Pedobacter sp. UBA4863]|uniref:carboxypeptidase-like regulatory domain-containing protein n=1 Tax=Pedobacter sp. UBA4863 TaxID=1947060 RepID=UPI0025FCDAA8|nr:carboxypeptidase-like regulatory domain-containing protein [Pedobacter sp. UBA4863]
MGNNEWLDIDVLDDYLEGKLDAGMMHKVERVSLEDPFVAQALAGLTEAKKRTQTLSILQRQLHERIAEKPVERKMWRIASMRLSIAATAAVLFLTVSVLFWMRENYRQQQAELAANKPKTIEIALKPEANAVAVAPVDTVIRAKPATLVDEQKVAQALNKTLAKGGQAIAKNKRSKEITNNNSARYSGAIANDVVNSETTNDQKAMRGVAFTAPKPVAETLLASGLQSDNAKLVKGIVADVNGQPIAGAAVQLTGANLRTTTNASGEFELAVDKDSNKVTLEVASLGFARKNVAVKTNEKLDIRLQEANNALNEVMVVGVGEARKKTAVSSKSTIITANELIIGVPAIGWKAYNEYLIKSNKLYVDGTKTVRLSFSISANGSPKNIKVEKSEGKAMDDEAVRLLKNGGKWKLPTGKITQTSISIKF